MKYTLLFLLLFMFSCSSEPPTAYTECWASFIILEKDKDGAADHAQKMLPERLLSLSLSGDDQDIEDAIEEAHELAYWSQKCISQDVTSISFKNSGKIGLKSYTYRYLWCLYAIVWGIQQYDKFKEGEMK